MNERTNCAISDAELKRRWQAVREQMQLRGIHVLHMRNHNDYLGGYVKWFTDLPASTGYPVNVLFPLDDDMTYVFQGSFGLDKQLPLGGQHPYRGVRRLMGAPGYASVGYSQRYEARVMEQALQQYARATIGILGAASHSVPVTEHLRSVLAQATFVDASDLVDEIKAIKSAEEIELIRRTAQMQDTCMKEVFRQARPGMRDIEVSAIAEQVGHGLGSEQGVFLCASAPQGTAAAYGIRHHQNRTIRDGDYLNILIENNGPGGFYTELGRMCVFGKANEEMHRQMAFVHEAQRFVAGLLRPKANCAQIWAEYNAYMRDNGRPEEQRLFSHGQGYDLVERPLVRDDEALPLAANMSIACHPTYATSSGFYTLCDNFLIDLHGARPLHSFPAAIVEL